MEKELSELKTEKETLKTKIIQQEEDKKTRNVEEEKLKEENIQLGFKRDALQNSNHEQIRRIEILKKKKRRDWEKSGRIGETDWKPKSREQKLKEAQNKSTGSRRAQSVKKRKNWAGRRARPKIEKKWVGLQGATREA